MKFLSNLIKCALIVVATLALTAALTAPTFAGEQPPPGASEFHGPQAPKPIARPCQSVKECRAAIRWQKQKRLKAEVRADRAEHTAAVAAARLYRFKQQTVSHSIMVACVAFHVSCSDMRSVAWCESKFHANARNKNSTAKGTFQYLDGTWASTPFHVAGFSVFDTYANSLATAQIVAKEGWSQWECKP